MPYAEYSARDSSQRILCKMGGRQRGCKTRVLHTDFDGNCLAFTHVKLQSLAHSEAQRITETVVKNNYQHDEKTTGHNFGRVSRYNSGYDGHDGSDGNKGQNLCNLLSKTGEQLVDDAAQHDGNDHNLYDG